MKPRIYAAIALIAVTVSTADAAPPAGKIFRFRLPFEPASLDWNMGDIPIDIIQNSMRGLYRVDEAGEIIPELAETGIPSRDGKTWTFTLKPGVRWSDGVPLSAHQFTDSFKRLLDPATASSYAYFLYDIEGAEELNKAAGKKLPPQLGVKILSENSFEIRLRNPVPYLPAILTHWVTYPVRLDQIAKYKDLWFKPEKLATVGPYRITEWKRQIRIVLEPNAHYLPKPWLQRIEGWVIQDDDTALNLYQTGHLEFITEPGTGADKSPDLIHRPSPIVYYLGVGPGHPLTTSKAGILALARAIDRTEIPAALGAPHRPAAGLIPPEIWKLVGATPPAGDSLAADPAAARALLKEAGFAAGPSGTTNVPPLTLYYFNRPQIQRLAEWLQGQWKKNLGLNVTLEGRDPKAYWPELGRNPKPLFLNSKGASYPDPDAFFRLFSGGNSNPQNLGRWNDADYDRMVTTAGRTASLTERRTGYLKASEKLLVEKPGLIPLYFRDTRYLIKPFVKNLSINPLTTVYLQDVNY